MVRPLRNVSQSIGALIPVASPQRVFLLTPPIPRWLFTALGEPKTIALSSVSMDQIIGLTAGSNGRWCAKIRSMALAWSLNVSEAGAGRMFSIEDMVWDSQRTSVTATLGRTLCQSQRASRQVRTRGCGMTSKRHLFKDTFGLEMHLMY